MSECDRLDAVQNSCGMYEFDRLDAVQSSCGMYEYEVHSRKQMLTDLAPGCGSAKRQENHTSQKITDDMFVLFLLLRISNNDLFPIFVQRCFFGYCKPQRLSGTAFWSEIECDPLCVRCAVFAGRVCIPAVRCTSTRWSTT